MRCAPPFDILYILNFSELRITIATASGHLSFSSRGTLRKIEESTKMKCRYVRLGALMQLLCGREEQNETSGRRVNRVDKGSFESQRPPPAHSFLTVAAL